MPKGVYKRAPSGTFTRKTKPLMQRVMEKISPEPFSGCWLWMAALGDGGYGITGEGRRGDSVTLLVHRVTYENLIGPIPPDLELDHLCRVRCCCNPHHLEPVTTQENLKRGLGNAAAAYVNRSKTHCPQGHEYTPKNTYVYKNRRSCRACHLVSAAASRKKVGCGR
jgi:hypothetical protein